MHKKCTSPLNLSKMCVVRILLVIAIYLETLTWQHSPLCAAYQYFILGKNGDYKYGYRTSNGIVVRQEADSTNQVSGHYFYGDNLDHFGLKYTSGVQGFSPENFDPNDMTLEYPFPQGVHEARYFPANTESPNREVPKTRQNSIYGQPVLPFRSILPYQSQSTKSYLGQHFFIGTPYLNDLPNFYNYHDGENRSYKFLFDTGNYKKEESSDAHGNICGYFEYEDDAGYHDLRYMSSDETGFQVTGGNLAPNVQEYLPPSTSGNENPAKPNQPDTTTDPISGQLDNPFDFHNTFSTGNLEEQLRKLSVYLNNLLNSFYDLPYSGGKLRSYMFSFVSGNVKIEEYSDQHGDIRGYFQYEDNTGHHDLRYITNGRTGFHLTGGNLATNIPRYVPPCMPIKPDETESSPSAKGSNMGTETLQTVPTTQGNQDEIIFVIGETTEMPAE